MWQVKRVENQDYLCLVKHDVQKGKFLIFMATLEDCGPKESWKSEENEDVIVHTTKELNPLFDLDKVTMIAEIINLFNNRRTDVHWNIKKEDMHLKLELNSYIDDIPFTFEATLYKCDTNTCVEILMLPLLIIIKNLHHQKDGAVEIVKKKDEEIAEYRMNGATVTRRSIETPAFNESHFDEIFAEKPCNETSVNAKDLLEKYVISYLNKTQHMTREELNKNQDIQSTCPNVEESQVVQELGREKNDSRSISASEIIPETKRPAEKMTVPKVGTVFHQTKPNSIHKSKPKKLKNL